MREALDSGKPFQATMYDVEISAGYMDSFAGLVEITGHAVRAGHV